MSSAADAVVAAARSLIGAPYVWGGEGPTGDDCSGLCQWSYAQIGVAIPRTSQEQAVGGQPVNRADLQLGDLIIYYSDASHVALYSGAGNVVEASTFGYPIAEVPIDAAGPYNCARRYLTHAQEIPVTDTLFADVSEFQPPVDDSYPYPVLSIRVCDGTYQDHKFARNYAWMRSALDSGKLTFGIVYTYVRPGSWQANAQTVRGMIDANGGLHPRVALMLDVESGGNPGGDQSGVINALHDNLAQYAGSAARVIGYGNTGDLNSLWPNKPDGIRLIVAGYGADPAYPGKVAHQYTDGTGFGGGLPEGCAPFGNCDMNSADGLDADQFAAACGITDTPAPTPGGNALMALTDQQQANLYNAVMAIASLVFDNNAQLRGPNQQGWPQLGQNKQGQNLSLVDATAEIRANLETLVTPPKGN